jgi:transposase
MGPITVDTTWQAQAGQGFDSACFPLDWDDQHGTGPGGQRSHGWADSRDNAGNPRSSVRFAKTSGQACPVRTDGTHSVTGPRTLSCKPRRQHELWQWARHREHTEAFKERYAKRAGIAGTISQGTRSFGVRRSRYMGQANTHLQHLLSAVAMHLARFVAWINGVPRSTTSISPFATLPTGQI